MVTTAGVIMSTAYFLPYGGYRYPSTPPPSELTDTGFTGHKHNDSVGLIYMNARYYVPAINRFLTADTVVPGPTNPQAFNRYTYVLGNPLRLVDPSGHGQCDADGNCQGQPTTPLPPPSVPPSGKCLDGGDGAICQPHNYNQYRRERTISNPPSIIQNATPFTALPFDPSAYKGGGVQGFGDTEFASTGENYNAFGYLHSGVDIPMTEGTELLALGEGVVFCGTVPNLSLEFSWD